MNVYAIAMVAAVSIGSWLMPSTAVAQETQVFAVVPRSLNSAFYNRVRSGCRVAERELDGVVCLYIGPPRPENGETQARIIADLIVQGVDGIAVSPANTERLTGVFERARDAGIPLITLETDLPPDEVSLRRAHIATDDYAVGANLAELVKRRRPNGGRICIQSGRLDYAADQVRLKGLREGLARTTTPAPSGARLDGDTGWTEVDGCPLFTGYDSHRAVAQMKDILGTAPAPDAFVSVDGWVQYAVGDYRKAVEPYRALIENGRLTVVAAETVPSQLRLLRDGLSHGQVGRQPKQLGKRAIHMLKDIVDGRAVDTISTLGVDVCTPKTAEACLTEELDGD